MKKTMLMTFIFTSRIYSKFSLHICKKASKKKIKNSRASIGYCYDKINFYKYIENYNPIKNTKINTFDQMIAYKKITQKQKDFRKFFIHERKLNIQRMKYAE